MSAPVRVTETALPGVFVVHLSAFRDRRGYFVETFNEATFAAAGLPTRFVQDNLSRSSRGVLRGLHFQRANPQGKLVQPVNGSIFDVAVDVRVGSPTFGRWVGVALDAADTSAVWVPPGFAHGFCALADDTCVAYKCTALYDAADEGGILWNDPDLAIRWPVSSPIVSERDAALPRLKDRDDLPIYAAGSG